MNIYLIRHAEKDTSDKTSPEEHFARRLTDTGKMQAQRLGSYLKDKNIETIYSSNMPRAIETAHELKKELNIKNYFESAALREADPSIIPTEPDRDKIKSKCWEDWDYKPQNGESYNEGRMRFYNYFWNKIVASNPDSENIAIVSHGRVIRLFLSEYLKGGKDAIKEKYKHVAVTHLVVKPDTRGITIASYNFNDFLPKDLRI